MTRNQATCERILNWPAEWPVLTSCCDLTFFNGDERSADVCVQDIKSGNVMLTKGFTAKIGDVGLAAVLERDRTRTSSCGTLEWAAPEVRCRAGQPSQIPES